NLAIELIDDVEWRSLWCADAGPRAGLETGHELRDWRDVREGLQAGRGVHRERAQPAGSDVRDRRGQVVEHDMDLSADEVGQCRRRAPIRHMQHVDARHHLEQLAGYMSHRSAARRSEVDLPWIG